MNTILRIPVLISLILANCNTVRADVTTQVPPGFESIWNDLPEQVQQTILEMMGDHGQGNGHTSPNGQGHGQGLFEHRLRGGGSSGTTLGDFNGDGYGDLAVGLPGKDVFSTGQQGAVVVIYGSPTGLNASTGSVLPSQIRVQDYSASANIHFGYVVLAGDFNGDGFSDLAVSDQLVGQIPFTGTCSYGLVRIYNGSPQGVRLSQHTIALDTSGVRISPDFCLGRTTASNGHCPSVSDSFGAALAWGDFNNDGFGDLAVGDPHELVERSPCTGLGNHSGMVAIFFGSSTGLSRESGAVLHPFLPQFGATLATNKEALSEDGERFGAALAAGDFNGDGRTDLAVGAPDKDFGRDLFSAGIQGAGMVMIFHAPFGPGTNTFASVFSKGNDPIRSQGLGGTPVFADHFGASLAAADFDGDGRSDLAIGIPNERVAPNGATGAVNVLYSRSTTTDFRLGVLDNQFFTQDRIFGNRSNDSLGGKSEDNDVFGFSLAAGDFNADGFRDLAIGAPGEDVLVNGVNRPDAGEVDVIYGSASRLSITVRAPQTFRQTDTAGVPETADRFGMALTAWNFGKNETVIVPLPFPHPVTIRTSDLVIGIPFENIGSIIDAGSVDVLYGNKLVSNGLSSTGAQGWHMNSPGIPDQCFPGDLFGSSIY